MLPQYRSGISRKNAPRRYLGYLKMALDAFKGVGPIDVGITSAHIAEAYYLLHKNRKFEDAKLESEKILSSIGLNDFRLAQAYLLVADCAARIRNAQWEKEALASGFKIASRLENLDFASYYIQRQSDLEHGRNTLLAEMEPGRLKRPPMFGWYRDLVSYTAIPPSSSDMEERKK
jgi:hypothetical protein